MSTYLFAWNPKRWTWNDLDAQIEQVGLSGHTDGRWSSGNTKQIPAGSRFFLIRLGVEPKGIVGSGVTLSLPDYGPHWDEEKAASGGETLYCDIRFDHLSNDVLVTWSELQQSPFSSFRWGVQASGISIPMPVAEALEELWQSRTAGMPSTPSSSTSATLPEGAKRKVVVNAYERNPLARAACIAHYGHQCQVCRVDLGEKFGGIAEGFIHVHHIVPLASVGRSYAVDPIHDLVPVCPTCHAVIHLRIPPLSVAEARTLLATHL
ncbi:MAG: HNH endonuclease [Polaromonas sp.]